jgi:hypothetical protein
MVKTFAVYSYWNNVFAHKQPFLAKRGNLFVLTSAFVLHHPNIIILKTPIYTPSPTRRARILGARGSHIFEYQKIF